LRSGERAARLEVSNEPARVGISSGLVTNRARRAHTPAVPARTASVAARATYAARSRALVEIMGRT
jgi:hypothetical protein